MQHAEADALDAYSKKPRLVRRSAPGDEAGHEAT
jgi:hypothetical protein